MKKACRNSGQTTPIAVQTPATFTEKAPHPVQIVKFGGKAWLRTARFHDRCCFKSVAGSDKAASFTLNRTPS
jgi:hypothetical protein